VKAKVVWGIGFEDAVCPPQTQFAVYNQLTSRKTMLAFPEYDHEYLPRYADKTRGFLLGDDEGVFAYG
jgi:cephalosporin-C deacetylase